jgi:hypothetical protein
MAELDFSGMLYKCRKSKLSLGKRMSELTGCSSIHVVFMKLTNPSRVSKCWFYIYIPVFITVFTTHQDLVFENTA